jgi:hypothetical protein
LATEISDGDGPAAAEGKLVYIKGAKEDFRALANFLNSVVIDLETSDIRHRHFGDMICPLMAEAV